MTEAATMGYQYRCGKCRTTSPPVLTRAGLDEERREHRRQFHGGHVPDGERVIEPEPFRFSDVPLGQWLGGGALFLFFLVAILIRTL